MTAFFQYEETTPVELEKIQLWIKLASAATGDLDAYKLAAIAAAWGREQGAAAQLDACCEWLDRRLFGRDEIAALRDAFRPKPPSRRYQAAGQLTEILERMEFNGLPMPPHDILLAVIADSPDF